MDRPDLLDDDSMDAARGSVSLPFNDSSLAPLLVVCFLKIKMKFKSSRDSLPSSSQAETERRKERGETESQREKGKRRIEVETTIHHEARFEEAEPGAVR